MAIRRSLRLLGLLVSLDIETLDAMAAARWCGLVHRIAATDRQRDSSRDRIDAKILRMPSVGPHGESTGSEWVSSLGRFHASVVSNDDSGFRSNTSPMEG